MREDQIQQQIIGYLSFMARKHNFVYFAPMNEGFMMIMQKFRVPKDRIYAIMNWLSKMGFLPGVSDIIILSNGKAHCMELKTKTGKQSKGQIRFMENVRRTAVEYEIARSLDDCKELLKVWGVIS